MLATAPVPVESPGLFDSPARVGFCSRGEEPTGAEGNLLRPVLSESGRHSFPSPKEGVECEVFFNRLRSPNEASIAPARAASTKVLGSGTAAKTPPPMVSVSAWIDGAVNVPLLTVSEPRLVTGLLTIIVPGPVLVTLLPLPDERRHGQRAQACAVIGYANDGVAGEGQAGGSQSVGASSGGIAAACYGQRVVADADVAHTAAGGNR